MTDPPPGDHGEALADDDLTGPGRTRSLDLQVRAEARPVDEVDAAVRADVHARLDGVDLGREQVRLGQRAEVERQVAVHVAGRGGQQAGYGAAAGGLEAAVDKQG